MAIGRISVSYPRPMASLPDSLKPATLGRQPMSAEVVAEHQRDRIAEASIEVFAKRGYQGTTVDHLVSVGKVGFAKFYNLFPEGKEDCFLHAYDLVVTDARRTIEDAIPPREAWPERVCAGLAALLRLVEEEPMRARLALVEAQTAGPAALALHEQTLMSAVSLIERGRELASRADRLPQTLEEATVGGLVWLLHQRLVVNEIDDLPDLLPELVEIVLGPYLGDDAVVELAASALRAGAASESPGTAPLTP
jgi:AcrR family transcriptional regulator